MLGNEAGGPCHESSDPGSGAPDSRDELDLDVPSFVLEELFSYRHSATSLV